MASQNGNVYREGLGKKWEARAEYWKNPTAELRQQYKNAFASDTVIGQYTFGTEKQSDLIFDYQSNVKLYPIFQQYLRTFNPLLLAVWGKNDPSFIPAGAEAFLQDVPDARYILWTADTLLWSRDAAR